MQSGIYEITCIPTAQKYIGRARSWYSRVVDHIRKLQKNEHPNPKFQAAWNEFGLTNFSFGLLEACNKIDLVEREAHWILKLNTHKTGFNIQWTKQPRRPILRTPRQKTYKSYDSMRQRCLNPNSPDYSRYGALGITICDRWKNSFDNFHDDMGDRPTGTTLDRYPNKNGNYEPKNCRWATVAQQQRNVRSNVYMTFQGETKLAVDWAREANIPAGILRRRIKQGASGPALFAPTYNSFAGIKDADGNLPERYRQPKKPKCYTAHGKTQTLKSWSEELGISLSGLKQRLGKYKMPPEKAFTAGELKKGKIGPRKGHTMVTAFDKTQSLTAWARELEIPLSTLRNRLSRAKMLPEEAFRK